MTDQTAPRVRPIPPALAKASWVVGGSALGLALLGFVVSFGAVSAEMEPTFGRLAPLVPLGIDLGILVFSGVHLLLIALDMPLRWLRLVPWALTAATVWLNVAAGGTLVEKLAHGVMPCLWALFVEVSSHAVAVRTGLATGKRMERIRRSRWLLAPLSTVALWRRMVLWETTSYRSALGMERDRLLARAELRSTYGWRWRRDAPIADRVRLRLGMLAPTTLTLDSGPAVGASPAAGPVEAPGGVEPSTAPPASPGQPHPDLGALWAAVGEVLCDADEAPEPATKAPEQSTPVKRHRMLGRGTQSRTAKRPKRTTKAPPQSGALSDDEAVDLIVAKHRERNPSKRVAKDLIGAGFGPRLDRLLDAADAVRQSAPNAGSEQGRLRIVQREQSTPKEDAV